MPAEQRATVMTGMMQAVAASGQNTSMLFQMITGMNAEKLPGVTVNAQNYVALLPILSLESQMVALNGMELSPEQFTAMTGIPATEPIKIPGLIVSAGDETMQGIYTAMTESVKTMTVTDEIFLSILGTMNAEDETFKILEETLYNMVPDIDATYASNLSLLGDAEVAKPASINFYAKDFESKEQIEQFIADYNKPFENDENNKSKIIRYTDMVGLLMSSITIIINAISYVLIAFVSISLVVRSS